MTDEISIEGLRPEAVLAALYNRSKPQGMAMLHYTPEDMTADAAADLLAAEGPYFDYLGGRVMKVRIPGPGEPQTIDPWLYDRDNGTGAAAAAIDSVRSLDRSAGAS